MNLADKLIAYLNPEGALRRQQARQILQYQSGGYRSGRGDRKSMRTWRPTTESADSAILPDLANLRQRARDLTRNVPMATGAINTTVTNVIGNGVQLKPEVDAKTLGMSQEQSDLWEKNVTREWAIFCKTVDFTSVQHFQDLQSLMFRSTLESGDIFVVKRYRKDHGDTYGTKVQFIEADRVSNDGRKADGYEVGLNNVYAGVEIDKRGRHKAYWVSDQHPGDIIRKTDNWRRIPARAKTGEPIVLHMFDRIRPDQSRGVPYLAPVIESLKQMGDYSEAEITAAVVSSMFTVFVKSETGEDILDTDKSASSGVFDSTEDVSLGNGAIVDLAPGEDVSFANPSRPNANFEPFMTAFLRQVGSALELPFELLIKHFTSSYSASRAALEMAWQFFQKRRGWVVRNFLQPVYEWFLEEAIAMGRISAPGFMNEPAIRMAYVGADWVGPTRIGLDPLKEANADYVDIDLGTKTIQQVIMERTGGNFDAKHAQRVKEANKRREDGLQELEDGNNESIV